MLGAEKDPDAHFLTGTALLCLCATQYFSAAYRQSYCLSEVKSTLVSEWEQTRCVQRLSHFSWSSLLYSIHGCALEEAGVWFRRRCISQTQERKRHQLGLLMICRSRSGSSQRIPQDIARLHHCVRRRRGTSKYTLPCPIYKVHLKVPTLNFKPLAATARSELN